MTSDPRDIAEPVPAQAPATRADRSRLGAWLRGSVRGGEGGLIALAIVVGIGSGLLTIALARAAALLHHLLFGHDSISAQSTLASPWLALVPCLGGLILGGGSRVILARRTRQPVDAIEANALAGGRMSIRDSAVIAVQTLCSNGFGASVGLEAGYTQLGSGLASWLGRVFNLRRADMRMMVGAGAAGAIAAAFDAPLTGAFYGFEIIIGTYTPFSLAPVVAAAIAGVLVARTIGLGEPFIGQLHSAVPLDWHSMAGLLALSLLCAGLGVAIMRGVTLTEDLFKRSRLPAWLQPAAGGLALGAMALVTPHVLASGHGAVPVLLDAPGPIAAVALALVLKSLASAISIGSGFRGGLFFASVYLGALVGTLFYGVVSAALPNLPLDGITCAVVGVAAMSVTIIGGPLTMSFLALESTGDFTLTILILATTTLNSVIVRRTFGYSFATWRLHLRGESIRSAQDVGWIRSLTVERLMRQAPPTVFVDATLAGFLESHPPGGDSWIVATDPFGRYAGMISLGEAHMLAPDATRCRQALDSLLRHPGTTLRPDMNVKEAVSLFESTETEALAVVSGDRRVTGLLTEAHALRRYTEELERARRELSGETWLARG